MIGWVEYGSEHLNTTNINRITEEYLMNEWLVTVWYTGDDKYPSMYYFGSEKLKDEFVNLIKQGKE